MGVCEGRWLWGLAAWWQGSAAPHPSCKACSAPGFVTGKAFHLASVCGVRYGFCGVIFLCKGKGYFSKCYSCIVRKNNVEFFSFHRKHCCVVEVAWVASSVSLCLQLLFIMLIKDRLGKSLWESDYGLLVFHSFSERSSTFHGYLKQQHLISNTVKRFMCSYSRSETRWRWFLFILFVCHSLKTE